MKLNSIKHTRQNCQGMTLIEVLVAAVVIAIGLMGVAALQVTALQGASNADYRSRAIDYATALSDRMHANLMAFEDEDIYDNTYTLSDPVDCGTLPVICAMDPTMLNTSGISNCNPAQMAAFDLWDVSCNDNGVQTLLPGGQLTVICLDNDGTDGDDGDDCTDLSPMLITINWQLQSDNNATDEVIMTVVPWAP
ncbi:MAG: type IV pilus modification protein PilV [Candidatus Thiodiazotropha sp. (ex Lucinoma kastoroae)]|nr:type IV pilus modification protein PilV [Candidatus Thiodiazotropha sp. (ex Lucinoma kastoroae)]